MSVSPPPHRDLVEKKERAGIIKQRSTGTSPVNFGQVQKLNVPISQDKPYGNMYDPRYRVVRHASETEVQTVGVGVGVDAETVRSHLQARDDLNTTQLLPMQSREKSFVSSLVRDDL